MAGTLRRSWRNGNYSGSGLGARPPPWGVEGPVKLGIRVAGLAGTEHVTVIGPGPVDGIVRHSRASRY